MDKKLLFNLVYGSSVIICLTFAFIYACCSLWKYATWHSIGAVVILLAYMAFKKEEE